MTKGKVLFLHHSTGGIVWGAGMAPLLDRHNREHGTGYTIEERAFPKEKPYGWKNYPYDYWNIWVDHAGPVPYQEEPTLEMLAPDYDLIVFKHCFPVSSIQEDNGAADVRSEKKTLANYKLQYQALKSKLRAFPGTSFLVWTPAALVAGKTKPQEAERTRAFRDWVLKVWDEPGDNIHVWDFLELETRGGLYLSPEYAVAPDNSHPTEVFGRMAAPLLVNRIVSVLTGTADKGSRTGA